MRTLIDIPEEDLATLQNVTAKLGISCAEFVRRAVSASLLPYRESEQTEAFGILAGKLEDGLAYEHNLRKEW